MEYEAEAYRELLESDGWKLLCQHLHRRAETSLANMRSAATTEEIVRHSLAYMAYVDLAKAPEILLAVAAQKLQKP